jgi:hypothetical protein
MTNLKNMLSQKEYSGGSSFKVVVRKKKLGRNPMKSSEEMFPVIM